MAEETLKDKVHQRFMKTVAPLQSAAIKSTAVALKELNDSMDEIDSALKDGSDPELLITYRRDLKLDMEAGLAAGMDVRAALDAVDEVSKDDADFEADQDEIKAAKKSLLGLMSGLKEALTEGDKRRASIVKALADADKDEGRSTTIWIGMMTFESKRESELGRALKAWTRWRSDAEAAVKSRDAKALADLQGAPPKEEYDDVLGGDYSLSMLADFAKAHKDANFSKPFRDRMKTDTATLRSTDKRMQAVGKQCGDAKAAVAKLAVAPRDAKKAAALLKLSSSAAAKLAPILALDDAKAAKPLEVLAKQNKVELDGAEAMAKLKKAGI